MLSEKYQDMHLIFQGNANADNDIKNIIDYLKYKNKHWVAYNLPNVQLSFPALDEGDNTF